MKRVTQIEKALQQVMTERADTLAVEMGVIRRVRKFTGSTLLHCLVFGWLMHAAARLEQLVSTAAEAGVVVTDTALQKRFTPECTQFLQVILQELTLCVIQAEKQAPSALLKRFRAVLIEDSSVIVLPESLATVWHGCGGTNGAGNAAVKVHVRLRTQRRTDVGTQPHRWTRLGSSRGACILPIWAISRSTGCSSVTSRKALA